ncbi:MAG: hypothetical protein A2270_06445 [Elusimicrobia bacterium RIFOXYA12_FULL_51_18]|nr:MAG: hypothetical protein A2270_06445 [Elusimicrobia bacterium RIFOXYA12_FULL_51_18]OGS29424.1 MAG: hypothetical protein A2218_00265 [Elusimicrobia bacterium RIFOXYA2_FULL_53_38]
MEKKTGVFRRLRNSGKRQSFCPQTCSPSRRDTAPDSGFKPSNGARRKPAAAPPGSIFTRPVVNEYPQNKTGGLKHYGAQHFKGYYQSNPEGEH